MDLRYQKILPLESEPGVFPFFKLSAEIRNMIYYYAIVPKNPIYPYVRRFESSVNTGLLYANRLTYQEASAVLYANVRAIVCNESHLLSRACCQKDFMLNPTDSTCEYPEMRLGLTTSPDNRICKKSEAYRGPTVRTIQPRSLARMEEIEIALGWLPCKDRGPVDLIGILGEVFKLLLVLCRTLEPISNQKDKTFILSFGNLL